MLKVLENELSKCEHRQTELSKKALALKKELQNISIKFERNIGKIEILKGLLVKVKSEVGSKKDK